MDELRMVRREDGALVLANELGDEYRFVVDSDVAAEIRQLTKRQAGPTTVRPREIQALLRAGKSRAEVAAETGLEEADVERFEEPVRAEQRYMLELARMVTVRTDPSRPANDGNEEQRFGEVISERLIGLGNSNSTWRSWRDETTGWLIGLAFDSRDGEHDAIWSLDHRKRVLTPLSPDATNLSKVGEIGDRLIPKLRAVESEQGERFDSGAFDPDALLADTKEHEIVTEIEPAEDSALFGLGAMKSAAAPSEADIDAEYERRREIDSLAVSTPVADAEDLNQTSDLLDALRRRRGEREQGIDLTGDLTGDGVELTDESEDASGSDDAVGIDDTEQVPPNQPSKPTSKSQAARNIWGASGVSGAADGASSRLRAVDPIQRSTDETENASADSGGAADSGDPFSSSSSRSGGTPSGAQKSAEAGPKASAKPQPETKSTKRGRSSIPSWDDILFGTRSDDDPA